MDRSETRKTFDRKVAAFIKEFNKKSTMLVKLIDNVDNLGSENDELSEKSKTGMIAGQVTLGVAGVIGICAAPFTGGVSLALVGLAIATGVAGGGASLGAHLKNKSESEEINKKFRKIKEEFQHIIKSLDSKLQLIVPQLSMLSQEYCRAKQEHLFSCKTRIKASSLTTFTGEVSLPEAKKLFTKCVEELEGITTDLEELPSMLDD